MPIAPEIALPGCAPTPLASYLKGLGVLRLLSKDWPETRGAWREESLILRTPLTVEQIEAYLLRQYRPTAILAPWNGGSGFYFQERKSADTDPLTGKKKKLGVRDQPTEATRTLDAVTGSASARLQDYRESLSVAKTLVASLQLEQAPEAGEAKDGLVRALRAELPDASLGWLDAALLVTDESTRFPPLLGSGGNDGNLDFSSNFMQRVLAAIGTGDEAPSESAGWLQQSLFGKPSPGLSQGAIGQFSPGQAGGPNGTSGFEADAVTNPWDFVLMIEGALSFAAAAVRRNADDPGGVLSFPFTVRAVGAGSGAIGGSDAQTARGEIWVPLWDRFASFAEVHALLSEGRVAAGRRPVRDALDFVHAVHHLGAYRGVASFQRFGLLQRSGRNFLATPLARVTVADHPEPDLLDDLEQGEWLTRLRRFAEGQGANHLHTLCRRLEDAVFSSVGKRRTPWQVQEILGVLGQIQAVLARSSKARDNDKGISPVPRLSERWVLDADDGTAAYRIARAVAGLRGTVEFPLPLRAQLFPVHPKFAQWADRAPDGVRARTAARADLPQTMVALLERRIWLARRLKMRDKPLQGSIGGGLGDIAAFLESSAMDGEIAALLPGLSLCVMPDHEERANGDGRTVPAAFALLKLALTPDSVLHALGYLAEGERLPLPVGMVEQLASGNADRAIDMAWLRLRGSGLAPVFRRNGLPVLAGVSPRRAAAALLIPLRYGAHGEIARGCLKPQLKAG